MPSFYNRFFREASTNNPKTGMRVWVTSSGVAYPTGSIELIENPAKDGFYSSGSIDVPAGNYDFWIDAAGGSSPSQEVDLNNTYIGNKTISDLEIVLSSDVITDDVSIIKHGYAPKAPNDANKYLDGQGNYTTPAIGGGNVVGPASSVDTNIVVFDGPTGKIVKDSLVPIASIFNNPMTQRGDIIVGSTGGVPGVKSPTIEGKVLRLTNEGGDLVPNWEDSGESNIIQNLGDMIVGGIGGVPSNLFKGITDQVLQIGGSLDIPQWQDLPRVLPFKLKKSIYVNDAEDNTDVNASPITIINITGNSVYLSYMPKLDEILNNKQYEIFVYNIDSNTSGDYSVRTTVLQTGSNYNFKILALDSVTGFSIGHAIAIQVHFRNCDYPAYMFQHANFYSSEMAPGGLFEHSNGSLRCVFTGDNGLNKQIGSATANDNVTSWSSDATLPRVPANGTQGTWYEDSVLISGSICRIGDSDKFYSAIFGKSASTSGLWQVGIIEFDEDFDFYEIFGNFNLPNAPGQSAPTGGYSNPCLYFKDNKWHLAVTARYTTGVAGSHNWDWVVEHYKTTNYEITNATSWIHEETIFQPPINNKYHFANDYIDSIGYFRSGNTEYLLCAGTTFYSESGVRSNRSYGLLVNDGNGWIAERRGAVFTVPAYNLSMNTGTRYTNPDLAYLNDHLGGYGNLINYKNKTYFSYSSKSNQISGATGSEYYGGVAKLKEFLDIQTDADR